MIKSTKKNIQIKLASVKDAEKCNNFFNSIYNEGRLNSSWIWEFVNNKEKSSAELPYVYAEVEGQVKGIQAYIEVPFISPAGTFKSAKSEDTLVDPSLRGMGVFQKMYGALFERAAKDNVRLIWGFTPLEKAFEKVGFETVGHVGQLIKPLKPNFIVDLLNATQSSKRKKNKTLEVIFGGLLLAYSRLKSWSKVTTSIELIKLNEAPEWGAELTKNFIGEWGGNTILRSANYLDWRFFKNPLLESDFWSINVENQIAGFVVTSQRDGVFYIVDFILSSVEDSSLRVPVNKIVDSVLADLADKASASGASGLRTWHGSDHPFSMLLKKRAHRSGWVYLNKGNAIIVWKCPDFKKNDSTDKAENYYITRAFTEGYFG